MVEQFYKFEDHERRSRDHWTIRTLLPFIVCADEKTGKARAVCLVVRQLISEMLRAACPSSRSSGSTTTRRSRWRGCGVRRRQARARQLLREAGDRLGGCQRTDTETATDAPRWGR